jgi:hypothetical protein
MSSCQCPTPPGGTVTCEPGQLAICSVKNGEVQGSCRTPRHGAPYLEVANWTLQIITEKPRYLLQPLSSTDTQILSSGKFERPDGTVLMFRMPQSGPEPMPPVPLEVA